MGNIKIAVLTVAVMTTLYPSIKGMDLAKEDVDKVIEDEITEKLSEDLMQSIERKFQVDLERSVDMVLIKIKLLLQNGTNHIQDKLIELQSLLDTIRKETNSEVDACLLARQNETAALAEKALHQMVVCGYALIGHDPTEAVKSVIQLKNMIKEGLTPIYDRKDEIFTLLKVCGHEHDTLRKVVKCVISKDLIEFAYILSNSKEERLMRKVVPCVIAKSPVIKSAMMDVTSRLIEGVVDLTKLMAHGAMHEACLIEVVKSIEDEAFAIVNKVKGCSYGNSTTILEEAEKYIKENNATVLNFDLKDKDALGMQDLLRRMMDTSGNSLDDNLQGKLDKFKENVAVNANLLSKEDKKELDKKNEKRK